MAAIAVINQSALIKTGLFQPWSSEAFNQLNDIDVSYKVSLDTVAENLGTCLRDIGLNHILGISRSHNHYKLNPEEIVQLSLGTSVENSTFKVEENATVAHLQPVLTKDIYVVPIPYMWAYDKDSKQFFPVQFFDGTNKIMQQRFNELCNDKRNELVAFLAKFIEHVEKTGTEDDLGFYIRYDDLMKLDKASGDGILEDTDVNTRQQWMTIKTKEMLHELADKNKDRQGYQMSKTQWWFDGLTGTQNGTCGHTCCCHCSHSGGGF